MAETLSITDLPTDIILVIIRYLSPLDLVAFCSTTRVFQHDAAVRCAAVFWRNAVKDTFRVPNQPVVATDGQRWMKLYRNLRTQTKIYGWGNNDGECFGSQPGVIYEDGTRTTSLNAVPGARLHSFTRSALKCSIEPVELDRGRAAIVADFQCGGWSTTVLDSNGILHTLGSLDSPNNYRTRAITSKRRELTFPPGYLSGSQSHPEHYRYNPVTAIKQFSSGRAHALGLSDSGRIWSWDNVKRPGLHIKFLTIDTVDSETEDISHKRGSIRKVVAGWAKSSAYVVGTGIVTWQPSNEAELEGNADQSSIDGMLVFDPKIVPESGYLRHSDSDKSYDAAEADRAEVVGEVTNYTLLRDYVVFVTHLGKVYASSISHDSEAQPPRTIQILPVYSGPGAARAENFALDVQGSFKSFAVFKRSGEVLIGDEDYLHSLWSRPSHALSDDPPRPTWRKIPSLQHRGVISMAFGDYHYHALHDDGSISSYGSESHSCGALGLGPSGYDTDFLRGLKAAPNGSDRGLLPQSLTTGRRIAFEPEKRAWLNHIWEHNSDEGEARKGLCLSRLDVRAEVSEWVEQRLNDWNRAGPMPQSEAVTDDLDDIPAYFALSVAAAGWHSGALVLVDNAKARVLRNRLRAVVPSPSHLRAGEKHHTGDGHPNSGDASDQPQDTEGTSETPSSPSTLFNRVIVAIGAGMRTFLGIPAAGWWVWAHESFPRLRLRSGEVLPGVERVVDWTGPSIWKEVERVVE